MVKVCRSCQASFEIADEDMDFYEKVSPVFAEKKYLIPPPTLCPECREQRRLAFRVERSLYNRKCNLCGQGIISIYSPEKSLTVYCLKCWWSDKWDPKSYEREYDFNRSFFDQFRELQSKVPQLGIQNDNGVTSENCEYCQDFAFGKNCYLVVGSWYDKDCMYCTNCSYVRDTVDCEEVNTESELVYWSIDCHRLYNCTYLQYSENCNNCQYGYDLKSCSDCFGCFGLRQKKFYIFNKPYSEEEYRKKMQLFNGGSHAMREKMQRDFETLFEKTPKKNTHLINCENSNGNSLSHCKNTYGFSLDNAEGCKFFYRGDSPQFCYDVHQSGRCKWCYECVTPDDSYMTCFSTWCWKDKYILYSHNCHNNSEYLFGCTALKKAKYCILNKQYTKEEYEVLVPKIIEHMEKNGEWGEFFPMQHSPFGYNETIANEITPLTQEQALAQGLPWREEDNKPVSPQTYQMPDNIAEVKDDILQALLVCQECGKNYKIIPQELAFYRKMILPIPRKCHNCRYRQRMQFVSPFRLWQRNCSKCHKNMEAIYPPEKTDKVYCEECYLKEVH